MNTGEFEALKEHVEVCDERHERESRMTRKRAWQADIAWGIATVIALLGVWSRLDANAQAKADAVQNDLNQFKTETHATMQRVDSKVDAILLNLHIPNPAPAPKDGGN